jgi:SAM-dependent methyltransferase
MTLPPILRQSAKRIVSAVPILRRQLITSTDYRVLNGSEEASSVVASSGGWFVARTARRQERAYQNLLAAMKRGEPRLDFTIAADAVAGSGVNNPRVLEVGCGSGYYSEVFAFLLPDGGVHYTGVDYSEAMIARGQARYPSVAFEVGDATRLPHSDGTFDIVFNGVSLLHILDYATAVREAARVASRYCIFHTVPIHAHKTTFLKKYAYGAPVVEIIFDKGELMSLCSSAGLELEREWPCIPYDLRHVTGHPSTTETYLFSKRKV